MTLPASWSQGTPAEAPVVLFERPAGRVWAKARGRGVWHVSNALVKGHGSASSPSVNVKDQAASAAAAHGLTLG